MVNPENDPDFPSHSRRAQLWLCACYSQLAGVIIRLLSFWAIVLVHLKPAALKASLGMAVAPFSGQLRTPKHDSQIGRWSQSAEVSSKSIRQYISGEKMLNSYFKMPWD